MLVWRLVLFLAELGNVGGEDEASEGKDTEQDSGGGHVYCEEVERDESETEGCDEGDCDDDEEHCISFAVCLALWFFFLV